MYNIQKNKSTFGIWVDIYIYIYMVCAMISTQYIVTILSM
jgi:hypothetical protein